MIDLNYSSLCAFSILVYACYFILLVTYRLYLHPLSSIPGPKLAAATLLYEFYYDVLRSGSYIWRIRDLHAQYGPIIRISPNAIHINDPDFYDIYSGKVGEKRNKYPWAVTHFSCPQSIIATVDHDHHRLRRSAVSRYFSKSNIRAIEPVLKSHVEKFMERIEGFEGKGKGKGEMSFGEPLNIWSAFKALASDVVTGCAFGESHDFLSVSNFNAGFWDVLTDATRMDALTSHWPWFLPLMMSLPEWVREAMGMGYMLVFERKSRNQLKYMIANRELEEKGTKTIFGDILRSNLPEAEKNVERMWHDGQVFNVAGSETTSWTLANCIVYLLSHPAMMKTLREELKGVMKARTIHDVTVAELEALPHLTAVLKESLRLSYGVSGRLYRISPDKAQVFNDGRRDWVLPAGVRPPSHPSFPSSNGHQTPISMTIPLLHHNSTIFPSPESFSPSRWLNNPALDKYLFAFSKGPRGCVGLNLAWAQMYLVIAALVGRYAGEGEGEEGPRMKLWKTGVDDVLLKHDFYVPGQSEETVKKGICVVVSG
ncbi:putative cytochrome P450 [Cadophora sp. DSE1049]|nr:putative cytochrome P450 [Cadophora sp. DSE1049]